MAKESKPKGAGIPTRLGMPSTGQVTVSQKRERDTLNEGYTQPH